MNDVVPFVEPPQQHPTEIDGPDAVVHFFEADGVLLERLGHKEQPLLEPERPRVGDALHQEVSRILAGWPGPGRRPGARRCPWSRAGRGTRAGSGWAGRRP